MRRLALSRGVLPSLLEAWNGRQAAFNELLARLDVDESTQTIELILTHQPISSAREFSEQLREHSRRHDEEWTYYTLDSKRGRYGIALPVATSPTMQSGSLALFVEIHSRLIAWWLTYAWRSRQLADATVALASSDQIIPAASCARALLETAAAFWADARRFAEMWQDAKTGGKPGLTEDRTLVLRQRFIAHLNEVQFGGKWTDKTPQATEVFGRFPRSNVLSAIDKLAKRCPGDIQTDYAWLCNTVHPSLGTALVFAGPPLVHETGTHMQRWLAGVPLCFPEVGDFDQQEFVEQSVPSATARASVVALDVLSATMAAALTVIDDVALTTGAPALADFDYWRALRMNQRNEPCACGSDRKSKHCGHEWGAPAPRIPETFVAASRSASTT